MARDRPSPYDEGGLSAAAAPVGVPPVVQDRLILNRSGAGAPELQRWAQYLPDKNLTFSALLGIIYWNLRKCLPEGAV